MSQRPSLLFIGTGYVAGSVLTDLLKEDRYTISATTRKDDHIKKLESLGVKGIKASLDDSDIITRAVSEHDIIINGASSDHPPSVDATLAGIEQRSAKGLHTIYIHTSGTGVLDDQAGGQEKESTVYKDDVPDQIEALNDGAPHRSIDKKISRVAEKLKDTATIRIILPPTIYGQGSGPFNQGSMQTPNLIRTMLKVGHAGAVGTGAPRWSNIHVLDLARAYVILLHALESNKLPAASPYDIYVFAEGGDEHAWGDLSAALGRKLHERGALPSAEVKPFTDAQVRENGLILPASALPGTKRDYHVAAGNSRSRALKLRKLGWQPREASFFNSLDFDVDEVLKQQQKS